MYCCTHSGAYVRYDICVRAVTDLGISDAAHVVAYSSEGSEFAKPW